MARTKAVGVLLTAVAFLTLIAAVASAQNTGVAGLVRDATGGVLPGVTVEAASPALIEKVRTAVTDTQGRYNIVDLRPGTYSVTFTLPGFTTFRREGIELTTSFTANVNADLSVGAIAETVVVSGATPTVDVQNVVQTRLLTAETVDAIPSGRTAQTMAANLIPGMQTAPSSKAVTQDVGGSSGDMRQSLAIHGGRNTDFRETINGISQNSVNGSGSTGGINMDVGAIQEFSYQFSGASAEQMTGGVYVNQIPKAGGNNFSGSFFGSFTNHTLQSNNISAGLIARGLTIVNSLDKIWDSNASVGGPIIKDKLWIFGSARYWGYDDRVATFYNLTPKAWTYTPDFSRQALDDSWLTSGTANVTWQASPRNKVSGFVIDEGRCLCHRLVSATIAPEATIQQRNVVDYLAQVAWSAPLTNRVLVDAAAQTYTFHQPSFIQPDVEPGTISTTEQSTGLLFRSGIFAEHDDYTHNLRASVSYITGSHAFKVGVTDLFGHRVSSSDIPHDIQYTLLNGVPRSITQNVTPFQRREDLDRAIGVFAQDQWTLRRLTVNAGIRYDHHNASVPEQLLPAVQFVGARDFAAIKNVPNWHDMSPRLGVSYDLFGNGKTAVKATFSRYVEGQTVGFAQNNNPVLTSVNSATRTWTDANRDYIPDCVLTNLLANGECGPLNNLNFGQTRITTTYDDAVREGWNSRGKNFETSVGVQQEVMRGVSATVMYYGRWYGNQTITQNTATSPSDYDPYCITAPVDPRLPGGGGNQICGLYDIKPAKFGQSNSFVTFARNIGSYSERYDGVDLTVNARLPRRALLQGGLNVGRSTTNACDVQIGHPEITFTQLDTPVAQAAVASVIEPRSSQYCNPHAPFQPNLKLLASYGLPWDLQASVSVQSVPGLMIFASMPVTSAQILPSLGRNLAAGPNSSVVIDLIPPGTRYGERTNQVDFRFTKSVKVGSKRLNANLDLYNALNANPVQVQVQTYGPSWQTPSYILTGRLIKFSGQYTF